MRIVCTPLGITSNRAKDLQCVLFSHAPAASMGAVGAALMDQVEAFGISPQTRAWDLMSIALSVGAADESVLRSTSSDGWTRQIELEVAVQDVSFWKGQKKALEKMLRFLTNDIWSLDFAEGGCAPPKPKKKKRVSTEDSVCLLSGGADSLAGAIDLTASGKNLLMVSQVSKGDKDKQRLFADTIAGPGHHLQLNHNIEVPGESERSQRGRSVIFITYGVVAATCLQHYGKGKPITLFIPENGFISLNVPLTPLRLGSLSTRTTHPYYINAFQEVLDAAGLSVRLENRFQLLTKGELLKQSLNQELLKKLVCQSTSCGRFARMGFKHCGRCVPCLIRRGSFHALGLTDSTDYVYDDLSINDEHHRNFDDVRSACYAVQLVKTKGLEDWIGGALSTTQLGALVPYKGLLRRGVAELEAFLVKSGAL